jgi:ABC-2 type transport system ATP-binding protein
MAVDVRNLIYRYGSFTAVDDVTLHVRRNQRSDIPRTL